MATILPKQVYEPANNTDGFRVLIERLWPRGITPKTLRADAWLKELAPSPSLRIWFKHHPENWDIFSSSYQIELKLYSNAAALQALCQQHQKITLLYVSKDDTHNHAVLLQQFLYNLQANQSGSYIIQTLDCRSALK